MNPALNAMILGYLLNFLALFLNIFDKRSVVGIVLVVVSFAAAYFHDRFAASGWTTQTRMQVFTMAATVCTTLAFFNWLFQALGVP